MGEVEYTVDGHIARVRLNRPQGMNAITSAMDLALFEAWQAINADPDIWCVILSAEGERAFCIGADVSGGTDREGRMALGGGLTGIAGPLVKVTKPMIAAVQGYVVGGGFEIAMCGDIIVAAENAQFGLPETKVGIIGECGAVHRVMRQLPYHIAMATILTGERINATDAHTFGLVNEVVPYADLMAAAERWAARICAAAPRAVQAAKDAALGRLDMPLEIALATRFEPIEAYHGTHDQQEGLAAAAAKRKPVWTGR